MATASLLVRALCAWAGAVRWLDEAWYVDIDPALRTARLVRRHVQFGRDQAAAVAWVENTDEPNARLIESTRERAQRVFRWSD